MTFSTTRSTAILICFIALIACVHAHPNGSEGFDDLDFAWISGMGSQFTEMIAHDQFANMTMMPVSSTPSRLPQPRAQSHPYAPFPQQSQPRYINDGSNMSSFASDFLCSTQPHCLGSMSQSYGYPAVPEPGHPPLLPFHDQAQFRGNEPVPSGVSSSHLSAMPLADHLRSAFSTPQLGHSISLTPPVGVEQRLQATPQSLFPPFSGAGPNLEVYAPCTEPSNIHYSMAQVQSPQPLPFAFSPSSTDLQPRLSRSAPDALGIMSSSPMALHNLQSGLRSNSVENMRGWIVRANTIKDRGILPRVNTDYLAPPETKPTNLSPVSASSTTPSSAKLGSKRKHWQMTTGDFVCFYCKAGFPTQGDLTHHLRSHAPYMSRQHVCPRCDKRFQYRKDLTRHLPKHDPNRKKYYCRFAGCKYHSKGFGRQDHLDRHLGSQHPQKRTDTPQQS